VIQFSVPGKPQPWRRSRTNGKRHFTDAATVANQKAWAWYAKVAGARPVASPLRVMIVARFTPPKRASKADRARMLANYTHPIARPDADNIAKNLDALNGVAFVDDSQIVSLNVAKIYALEAGVDVTIVELSA
jgi:Holliday junction resolvase RusA-like endonuclease